MDPAMAPNPVVHWENLWKIWNVRIVVISSLFLEIILLFFGPLRKRSAKVAFVWWAYLLSPILCSYGLSFLYTDEEYTTKKSDHHPEQLLVLWSSFLILHFAGPDTITSISIKQNELWKSQYFYLLANCLLFGIIVVIACIVDNAPPSAVIVCIVGIKRCHDWVMSLKFSSKVGGERQLPKKLWLTEMASLETERCEGELTTLQVLKHAYTFFTHYKGLIVDYSFSFQNCSESRQIFLKLTPRAAFRVVERELNFFYEVLYTKAWLVKNWPAYFWRFLEISALFVALLLSIKSSMTEFREHDKTVTLLLLFGSIFIELSTVVMVASTDMSIAFLRFHIESSRLAKPLKKIRATSGTSCWFPKKIQEYINRRWSNCVCQCNLIKHSRYQRLRRFGRYVLDLLTSNAKTEGKYYGKTVKFNDDLKGLIVEQLRMKSQIADAPNFAWEMQQAKGEWTLRHENCEHLVTQIGDRDFDQILLTWHVATELCFQADDDNNDGKETIKDRNLSRCMSNYMLYLLMKQPTMMSTVSARAFKRYKDTCAEVLKVFSEKKIKKMTPGEDISRLNLACQRILSGDTWTTPNISGKDASMSVLMDACDLAKELNRLRSVRKWEVLSKVWVEMLCYAASHCKASSHMEELQLGGQLITIVWLLMVHFGLVK